MNPSRTYAEGLHRGRAAAFGEIRAYLEEASGTLRKTGAKVAAAFVRDVMQLLVTRVELDHDLADRTRKEQIDSLRAMATKVTRVSIDALRNDAVDAFEYAEIVGARLELTIETLDAKHLRGVLQALADAGVVVPELGRLQGLL